MLIPKYFCVWIANLPLKYYYFLMKKIIFVCLGNICRSPAAEYVFKKIIKDRGLENNFEVISRATSFEEVGNDIYPPMKQELRRQDIPFNSHRATRITQSDYDSADYIFYMEETNKRSLDYMIKDTQNKIMPIYKFTSGITRIEDPWYSDRYELVVTQITKCVNDILENIEF